VNSEKNESFLWNTVQYDIAAVMWRTQQRCEFKKYAV